jgi:hypothetical protein
MLGEVHLALALLTGPAGEASSSGFASRDYLVQRQANIGAKHSTRGMVDRVVAGAGPDWPESIALGVADQARRFESCLERFAGLTWGGVDATSLRLSQFVLADAPLAAVRPHLQRRETPPALVDEIITITYRSLTVGRPTPTAGFQRESKA